MIASETPARRGAFITLEGGEGGGKSTQVKALVARLRAAGVDVIATREPGGSEAAECIRAELLAGTFEKLGAKAEALLFAAARIDHLDRKIKPALAAGTWVISDRFHDSTCAYQGSFGQVEPRFLRALERIALAGTRPDLTLILDLPAEDGMARANLRRNPDLPPDRFEKESLEFHRTLRRAFLAIAAEEPNRCVIVDAALPRDDVEQAIWDTVVHRLRPSVSMPDTIGTITDADR